MDNQTVSRAVVIGLAMIGGGAIGSFVGKTVMAKAPKLEPVLVWTSGFMIGAAVATLAAPVLITKSDAAAILASN